MTITSHYLPMALSQQFGELYYREASTHTKTFAVTDLSVSVLSQMDVFGWDSLKGAKNYKEMFCKYRITLIITPPSNEVEQMIINHLKTQTLPPARLDAEKPLFEEIFINQKLLKINPESISKV